jgi:Arc/MetJ-type ribon-helix-helix transcriptional regulator
LSSKKTTKRIIVSLTEKQEEELDKMVKIGVYRTRSEAIRDAVRLLISMKKRREAFVSSNGEKYEYI